MKFKSNTNAKAIWTLILALRKAPTRVEIKTHGSMEDYDVMVRYVGKKYYTVSIEAKGPGRLYFDTETDVQIGEFRGWTKVWYPFTPLSLRQQIRAAKNLLDIRRRQELADLHRALEGLP